MEFKSVFTPLFNTFSVIKFPSSLIVNLIVFSCTMTLPSFRDLLLKKLTKEDCRLDILRNQERDLIRILACNFRVVISCVRDI